MGAHNGPVVFNEDEQFGKASPGKIAMWIFLVTDAMSFSGFLLAYAVLRHTQDWPNPIEALGGVALSGFMTFLLICSSVSMVLSIDACKQKDRKGMLNWLLATILGGAAFLTMQVYEYWHIINDLNITFTTFHGSTQYGLFGSTFYSVTAFHGLHVFTGVCYLIWEYSRARAGHYDNGEYNRLEIVGLFWHFVDLVWILVFTFVYLL